jgi:phosphoserine phosphatase RsbU/P
MPSLILLKSPGGAAPGQTFPLSNGPEFTIGRDADTCEIVIPNNSVSRKHAVVYNSNGRLFIKDLESRNGTFVNQNRIGGPTPLKNEDRIKICDFLFRYHDENALGGPPQPKADDENDDLMPPNSDGDTTTIQSSVNRNAANQLLDVQPAERLRALLDISNNLAKTLELEPLLPQIADTLFNVFRQADRCFIILTGEDGRLIPKVAKSRRPGPNQEAQFSRSIVRKCLDKLESLLSEDAGAEALSSQSIAEFRIRSFMVAPLATTDGKRLGVIQLDTQDASKKFRDLDLQMLSIVANLASTSIEKAQVHTQLISREKERKEIEVARKVQVGFLPKTYPDLPGYEFFAYYSPAQSVGGDYYDFITLPGGRVAVVLGDVAGKGVAAALLMAKLSAEVRFCVLTEADPAKAICLLNEQLIRGGIGDRFVTLAAIIIDPAQHQITFVNAGHINPKRHRLSGELVEIITNKDSGLPLGLVTSYPYEAKTLMLEPGDTIMVYTDGVTDAEAPDGARFNEEGVAASVQMDSVQHIDLRPGQIGDRVVRTVQRHANGTPQSDDIAFVCFGRIEGGPSTTQASSPRLNVSPSGVIKHPDHH